MTQTATITTGHDVVAFLQHQHEQITALFGKVASTNGTEREQAFYDLRRLLAVHETAEEEIVHPRAKNDIPGGEAIIDARLQEEHEAKEALTELEQLDPASTEFETKFRKLQADVLAHAGAEEQREFTQLADAVDDTDLQRMRNAVELAESMAPSRPHAGIESAGANVLAGPFAAMLDRARDALTRPK